MPTDDADYEDYKRRKVSGDPIKLISPCLITAVLNSYYVFFALGKRGESKKGH